MITIKKILTYLFILMVLLFCFRNYLSTTSQFFLSNISIREAFHFKNEGMFDANEDGILDFVKKGTHDGGIEYFNRIYKYINHFKQFQFNELKIIINKVSNHDIKKSEFYKEYYLINKLKEFSKIKKKDRSAIAIYIPKSNSVYWNLSCDSLMMPFIVPAISNITNILALPTMPWSNSCFGQLDGYGYGIYSKNYSEKIPMTDIDYADSDICLEAKKYKINKIIKIYFKNNDIVEDTIICK